MQTVSIGLLLLAVAAVTTGVVRKVPVPLPLLQIAAGAVLACLGIDVELEPELFLLVFIPPLLFIDGWRIPKSDFRRFRKTILLLAFGLVVVTVLAIGTLIELFIPAIPPFVAFALASALSPTDAVAVAGIAGRTPIPPRLMHILQGEALLNDASGLVCLRVAIAAIATGTFSWSRAAASLALVAAGGIAVGFCVAWLFSRLQKLVFGTRDDAPEGRILLIVVIPYSAYVLGEHVHVSGVLAAAAAGMVLPRLGIFDLSEGVSRRQTITVLGALELGLNGLVFVLLGLQLPAIVGNAPHVVSAGHLGSWPVLALAIVGTAFGLFAIRFVWAWVSMRLTLRERPHGAMLRIVAATAFAGARGAVSLAATLTLPLVVTTDEGTYPAREVGVCIAAGVILLSLVSASIGLPFAFRGVNLEDPDDNGAARAALRASLVEAGIAAVERVRDEAADPGALAEALRIVLDAYRLRPTDEGSPQALRARSVRDLRRIGIAAERHHLGELFRKHEIDDVLFYEAMRDIDALEEVVAKPAPRHH